MGYDVALIASITLPEDAVARWKKHEVDVEKYTDWPDVLTSPDKDPLDKTAPPKVGQLLIALEKRGERAGAPCAVREEGGKIELSAVLSDDPFTLFGPWVAAALRDASALGGKGRVDFIGFHTSPLAFSFDVEPGKSALRELDEGEVAKIEKTPQFKWLERAMDGAREPLPAFKWPKKGEAGPSKKPAAQAAATGARAEAGSTAGFGVVLSGEVRFPKKSDATKWGRTKVSPSDFADWPAIFREVAVPPTAPSHLGYEIQDYAEPPLAFMRVNVPELRASTKGVLRADALAPWGARVASAFRAAAAYGGQGKLRMLSPAGAPARGFVVEVKPGSATIREAIPADWEEAANDPIHTSAENQFGSALK